MKITVTLADGDYIEYDAINYGYSDDTLLLLIYTATHEHHIWMQNTIDIAIEKSPTLKAVN